MAVHRTDGATRSSPLERALDLYRSGLADLREAASEAGIDEWTLHKLADASGMPPIIGATNKALEASSTDLPPLEPFVRRR